MFLVYENYHARYNDDNKNKQYISKSSRGSFKINIRCVAFIDFLALNLIEQQKNKKLEKLLSL